jgi:hypothetical protein
VTLRAALRWAIKSKRISGDLPCIEVPSQPPPRDRWMTRDEADKLLASAQALPIRTPSLSLCIRPRALLHRWNSRGIWRTLKAELSMWERDVGTSGAAPCRSMQPCVPTLSGPGRPQPGAHVIGDGSGPVASIKMGLKAAARRGEIHGISPHVTYGCHMDGHGRRADANGGPPCAYVVPDGREATWASLGGLATASGGRIIGARCVRKPPDLSDKRITKSWCCWRGSNSRPLPYQGSALPLSYSSAPGGQAKAGRGVPSRLGGPMQACLCNSDGGTSRVRPRQPMRAVPRGASQRDVWRCPVVTARLICPSIGWPFRPMASHVRTFPAP